MTRGSKSIKCVFCVWGFSSCSAKTFLNHAIKHIPTSQAIRIETRVTTNMFVVVFSRKKKVRKCPIRSFVFREILNFTKVSRKYLPDNSTEMSCMYKPTLPTFSKIPVSNKTNTGLWILLLTLYTIQAINLSVCGTLYTLLHLYTTYYIVKIRNKKISVVMMYTK